MGEIHADGLDVETTSELLERWHRATDYRSPLVDALVRRFDMRYAERYERAADLELGDDATIVRMCVELPRLEKQIYTRTFGTVNVTRYASPVEVASTTHWPGAVRADPSVFVRLVDDVRELLRVLVLEPSAFAMMGTR